jgi:hypothetical protein
MSTVSFFNIEPRSSGSSSSVTELPNVFSAIELDELRISETARSQSPPARPRSAVTRASTYHEVDRIVPAAKGGYSPPKIPGDLELSRPPSPVSSSVNVADVAQSWNNPPMNKWRLLAACLFCLANGCNDSAVSDHDLAHTKNMLMSPAWCITAIHRGILPHWLCHRISRLCVQRRRLYPLSFLCSCNRQEAGAG